MDQGRMGFMGQSWAKPGEALGDWGGGHEGVS